MDTVQCLNAVVEVLELVVLLLKDLQTLAERVNDLLLQQFLLLQVLLEFAVLLQRKEADNEQDHSGGVALLLCSTVLSGRG